MTIGKLNPVKAAIASVALVSAMTVKPVEAQERKPNVVIIFVDDMAYSDIGTFGAKGYTTPHLDQLAQQGRRFTNFHVPQPICTASRAGLMTGCYPNRIGLNGALSPKSKIGINDAETTLPQLFKSQGYATGMVGKWHLGDAPQFLPTRKGFDEYLGIPYSHDMWTRHPETPGAYPTLPLMEGEKVVNPDLGPPDLGQLTTMYTERAVSFIDRNKDKPFFLYLAHNLPHVPLFVSDKFKGKSQRGLYGDVVEEIDWSVGEVTKALTRNHLDQNTLVIFTSDNGPWLSYGEHAGVALPLREGKGTSWEGGTREPCIMRWPGKIPANTVTGDMAMTIDLLPTIARQIGAPLPNQKIDGLDIWPIISGQPGAKNPHTSYSFYYANNQLQAVTSGDGKWKLLLPHTYRTLNGRPGGKDGVPVQYENNRIETAELYDLEADRGETKNVANQHPDIVARLQGEAEKAREELGDSLTGRIGKGNRPVGQVAASGYQLVGKALTISCDVTSTSTNGVIVAQGGSQHGYTLYLKDGKPTFGVRQSGRLTAIAATEAPQGPLSLQARLEKDGTMTLRVNGAVTATGKAPGSFTGQPSEELSIGEDTLAAVGDYRAPNPLQGKVENLKITTE